MGLITIEIGWSEKDEDETEQKVTQDLFELLEHYDVRSITIY